MKRLVRYLKPLDDDIARAAAAQHSQLSTLDEQRRAQLAQIDQLKGQLAAMGVTDEQFEAARKKGGSSLCSVM